MNESDAKPPGLREFKRQQTRQRILEVGLESFLAKGYEATTLDEIAAAAGISRRTFFYYFKSKDDILLGYLQVYAQAIKSSVTEMQPEQPPLTTAKAALLKLIAGFQEAKMMATARLMQQSEALRSRRNVGYLQFEQAVYEGLCALYPERDGDGLKLVAMISISGLRLAVDNWLRKDGKPPLAACLQNAFGTLEAELSAPSLRPDHP